MRYLYLVLPIFLGGCASNLQEASIAECKRFGFEGEELKRCAYENYRERKAGISNALRQTGEDLQSINQPTQKHDITVTHR